MVHRNRIISYDEIAEKVLRNRVVNLDMVFASIDSDGYGEAGSIVMFTALPPLGWDRYTDLDDAFPRGASTAGGSGGSSSHSHSVTIETGAPSATDSVGGSGASTATDTHTHSCSTTTGSASNLPPYLEVIYGQRKDPSVSTSLGVEEEVSGEAENPVTYTYLYDGDNNMIAETIGLTTTIYIGNIYEKKDQGGTITEKKYYMAGSLRVAVSTKVGAGSWDVNFLLSDHLGSTSTTVDSSGDRIADLRYKPWGSTRYAWGTQVTSYTYTGQRSVESFGLMYYYARWYDASLGRFVQADSIIPCNGNPISWDRFAYVMNNSVNYIDPSGHLCAYTSGGNLICSLDDDSFDEHGNPVVYDPDTMLGYIPPPENIILEDVPGIGEQDGTPGYEGLMTLVEQYDAWWWDDGVFTLEEALAIVLYTEVSMVWTTVDGVSQLPDEVIDAAAYKYQTYCGGGWDTADCFIGFWSYYQPIINIDENLDDIMSNPLNDPVSYGGNAYMQGAASILSHSIIPESNNYPQGWATIYDYQEVSFNYIENHSFSFVYQYPAGNAYFIVLTANEQSAFCVFVGMGDWCNLTDAP